MGGWWTHGLPPVRNGDRRGIFGRLDAVIAGLLLHGWGDVSALTAAAAPIYAQVIAGRAEHPLAKLRPASGCSARREVDIDQVALVLRRPALGQSLRRNSPTPVPACPWATAQYLDVPRQCCPPLVWATLGSGAQSAKDTSSSDGSYVHGAVRHD